MFIIPVDQHNMQILAYVYAVLSITKVAQSKVDETSTLTRIATQMEAGKYKMKAALRHQFTLPTTAAQTADIIRTTPVRISFTENCDYLAHYCLKAYNTGKLCGRTLYFSHYTFKNYCMMDYVNCMERYQVWQIVHMGPCFVVREHQEYMKYPYDDDYFLDQYYVLEDH